MLTYAHKAAKLLDKAHMIRYAPSGDLMATNLGRTASYYYINFDTMEVFNEKMNPGMTEADIIEMMCFASEFQQIQVGMLTLFLISNKFRVRFHLFLINLQ